MYECHVTVERPVNQETRELYERVGTEHGWKTSMIDGDPVLGKKVFFYFTKHGSSFGSIKNRMFNLEEILGDRVVRSKIEHIVYDTKTKIGL